MRVVASEQWAWMLYEDGDRRILDVLCNHSAFHFGVTIELDAEETAAFRREGATFIAELAARIQHSPQAYRERHLPDFRDAHPAGE